MGCYLGTVACYLGRLGSLGSSFRFLVLCCGNTAMKDQRCGRAPGYVGVRAVTAPDLELFPVDAWVLGRRPTTTAIYTLHFRIQRLELIACVLTRCSCLLAATSFRLQSMCHGDSAGCDLDEWKESFLRSGPG